jgi:hypothetical protein
MVIPRFDLSPDAFFAFDQGSESSIRKHCAAHAIGNASLKRRVPSAMLS